MAHRTIAYASVLLLFAFVETGPAQRSPPTRLAPTALPNLRYTNEFFPGASYRVSVPAPEALLGFAGGERAATSSEIEWCLRAWTNAAPDRARLVEYARSHEGRPLHYVIVTAPKNMTRLGEIRDGLGKLADPRKTTAAEAERLTNDLPAVAWLAYTIHGDETEGSDAALAVLYHLLAAREAEVGRLLEDLVVIIDPLMNPDGRDRFLKMVAEHRGTSPNVDDQSLLHEGYWPWGRGNHYLFDLNRDWILGVHPETRGRIREVARWNPVLFVDAHGMGSQDTHLFSPPRQPINPNIPQGREHWGGVFARDQARAFDRHQLVYYHGEWAEEWYPGYSDSWASYRGAVGILYEEARIAEDGVRRPEGRILSYRESVRHHVIGTMANLTTLQGQRPALLSNFWQTRTAAVAPDGPYALRTFAILPTSNRARLEKFIDLMRLQGVEVSQAAQEFKVASARDQLGRDWKDKLLPAGTVLIPNRQPLAHLLAAMLEFDPKISTETLADERRELLRKGKSRIYDITAWNLTMLHGLEAFTLPLELPAAAAAYSPAVPATQLLTGRTEAAVAYAIEGRDDRSVTAAARLMERGVQVRAAEKAFRFDESDFGRGSLVVTPLDNRGFSGDLRESIRLTIGELGLSAVGIQHGLGDGDLPDLGGSHFRRLEPPRIALLGRGRVSPYDYGAVWYLLDHVLGMRHSRVEVGEGLDLSRYNVLIIPDQLPYGPSDLPLNGIKAWVKAGGSLVVIAEGVTNFVAAKAEFSKVRALPAVLGSLGEYEMTVLREWQGRIGAMPAAERIWAQRASPSLRYPWQAAGGAHPEEKELKKRDAWQKLFMPQGALLAGRIDTNHWLTFGCDEPMPLLVGDQPVLMAGEGVEAPVRYGVLLPEQEKKPEVKPGGESTTGKSDPLASVETKAGEKKEPPRLGWSALPEGTELHLRMSGLLWPEATHRLANAAWVTREPLGRGQIILFATPPAFRASAHAAARVFLNAIVYGPGLGAAQPIKP